MVDRYDPRNNIGPVEGGPYVRHADYATLQAEVERLTKERDEARTTLAAWDINSLPNDMGLVAICEARISDLQRQFDLADKYKWQVRDTCTRAEAAESSLAALKAEVLEVLKPFADVSPRYDPSTVTLIGDGVELWQSADNKGMSLRELGLTVGHLRAARSLVTKIKGGTHAD